MATVGAALDAIRQATDSHAQITAAAQANADRLAKDRPQSAPPPAPAPEPT